MNNVFIIGGPTSTGKTSLAIELCKKFNGEIISADSRQVVKYMDIGTGKIPLDKTITVETPPIEQTKTTTKDNFSACYKINGINIWGYDLVDPNQYFSAYDFAKFALKKAKQLLDTKKTIFIVGGTGFYIDMVTNRINSASIGPNYDYRTVLSEMSLIQLQEKLKKLNPEKFEKIDTNNKMRLMRALEIEQSKILKSSADANQATVGQTAPLPYLKEVNYIYIGLTAPREVLYKNTDAWLDTIWHNGLINEIQSLLKGPYASSLKLQGLVYKQVVEYLKGETKETEAIQKAKFALHAYIRRQQTWFKQNKDILWFDISSDNFNENVYNFLYGEAQQSEQAHIISVS